MPGKDRFREFVLPHLDAGYNLARSLARDVHDAEDVVQDACVRALKYVGGLHGGEAKPWFLTIVRHAFYDWCRQNRAVELVHGDDAALDGSDERGNDPESLALRHSEQRTLAAALAELPLVFREVLVLRELEELSYKEIARVTDVPIGTVMSRLARARALLRRSPLLRAVDARAAGGGP